MKLSTALPIAVLAFTTLVGAAGTVWQHNQVVSEERLVASMIEHKKAVCEANSHRCHFEYSYRAHELHALVSGQ